MFRRTATRASGPLRDPYAWDTARIVSIAVFTCLAGALIATLGSARVQGVKPIYSVDGDAVIFDGSLTPGWDNWSWGAVKLGARDVTHNGKPVIRFEPSTFKGLYFHHSGLNTTGYRALSFWVHGGATGLQKVALCTVDQNKVFGPKSDVGSLLLEGSIPGGKWTFVVASLSKLKCQNATITGVSLQDSSGSTQSPIYIADIRFVSGPRPVPKPVQLTVDATRSLGEISPFIFGMAGPSAEEIRDLRLASNRWGGNPASRYNWELGNAWSAARDWEYRNGNYGATKPEDRKPSGAADRAIRTSHDNGAATVLTIPMIGWVAKDDNNGTRSVNVPGNLSPLPDPPGSESVKGYNPAENRARTSVRSFPRKRQPFADVPDLQDGIVYQDEWVHHLVKTFGKADRGGVRFYAMDNEPDLWSNTHTDIHPVGAGYDEILTRFLEYSSAVKAVDSSCEVLGPVSWGWTGYMHSSLDKGNYRARPDRKAHGDLAFIPWFLQQMRTHDQRTGNRLLDVLDIHYYPQANGVYSSQTNPSMDALRLRTTRSLWDAAYVDESWIGEPVRLIPRMKEWIAKYYPGVKLGITEWNFGADHTVPGGIAVAEALGVFCREGVYLANYWMKPKAGSPGYLAFKLFRNAGGQGEGIGGQLAQGASNLPAEVSCFASIDQKTGAPVAIIINKTSDLRKDVSVAFKGRSAVARGRVWSFGSQSPDRIVELPELKVVNGGCRLNLPPLTAMLIQFR